jgi:hypothetical protein
VVGAISQGNAASDAANHNAQMNQQNAQIATQQGEAQALQQRRINELRMGTIRAGYGASGVIGGEGSPLDVLSSSAEQAELDVQNIKYNAGLKAMGYGNSAALDQSRADGASSGGLYTAASKAILGGAKAFDTFSQGSGQQFPDYGPPGEAGDSLAYLG